jgi:hypothetical protein
LAPKHRAFARKNLRTTNGMSDHPLTPSKAFSTRSRSQPFLSAASTRISRRSLLAILMAIRARPSPPTCRSPQRRPCSPPSRAAAPASEISHPRHRKTPR